MDINPLIAREMRARWRNPRAFGLILVYVAMLAAAMVGSYSFPAPTWVKVPTSQRLQVLGHHMFQTLTWMQTLAWLLIAPALTATSIAAERECGLLEGMTLSHLTPRHIVAGKLLAALSFMLLVLLVALPIVTTCFIMGGVAPTDLFLATLLQAVTAINCAIMGLLCSAWSRRAGEAAARRLCPGPVVGRHQRRDVSHRQHAVERHVRFHDAGHDPAATRHAVRRHQSSRRRVCHNRPYFHGPGSAGAFWAHSLPPWTVSLSFQTIGALVLLFLTTRGVSQTSDSGPAPTGKRHARTLPGAVRLTRSEGRPLSGTFCGVTTSGVAAIRQSGATP